MHRVQRKKTKTACVETVVGHLALLAVMTYISRPVAADLTAINYTDHRLHSTALILPTAQVYANLGLSGSEPLAAVFGPTDTPLPTIRQQIEGRDVILVFCDFDGFETKHIRFETASVWPSLESLYSTAWNPATKTGHISNGIARIVFGSNGYNFLLNGQMGTEAEWTILKNIYFKGWLDNQDRGAITGDPAALELTSVDTRTAAVLSGSAGLVNGVPTLTLQRSFSGMGSDVLLTETWSLYPGKAAARYRLLFANNGSAPAYLAWANGQINGTFNVQQVWNQTPYWLDDLFDLRTSSPSHSVKYWYNPPAWAYCSTWPTSGYGTGMTTLKLLSGSHYHNKTHWGFSKNSFSLTQVETVSGYLPIAIMPGAAAEMGGCFLLTEPETNAFSQTRNFFEVINAKNTSHIEHPYALFWGEDAVQGARLPVFRDTFTTTDRWIAPEGTLAKASTGAVLQIQDSAASIKTALEFDFSKPKILNLDIAKLSENVQLTLSVKPIIDNAEPILLVGPAGRNQNVPNTDGLLAHYRFDETGGTIAHDETNRYPGEVINGSWQPDGWDGNGCLKFNGTAYVRIPQSSQLCASISDEATYAVWVHGDPDAQPRHNTIFYGNNTPGGGEHNPLIYVPNSGGDVIFEYGHPTIDYARWYESVPSDWKGQWNHYAFTKNAATGQMKIYVNGRQVAENNAAFSPISQTTHLTIGAIDRVGYQGLHYIGKLDDFRIYNKALTRDEILAVMGADVPWMTITQPGTYTIDISSITGWIGQEAFELQIRITGQTDDFILINSISLSDIPPVSPELISPLNDVSLTDIAGSFSWMGVPDCMDYDLQYSADSAFSDVTTIRLTRTGDICNYTPEQMLTPGQWFWRVRAIGFTDIEGDWSAIRRFDINDNHTPIPLIRPVTPERPLFTLEACRIDHLGNLANAIPSDIRPFTAIANANDYSLSRQTNYEHFVPIATQENHYLLRTHGPDAPTNFMPLAEVEWFFQQYPTILGICTGENLWSYWQWDAIGYKTYVSRLIQLCAKYGRLYIMGDGNGTTFKWQQYASDEFWLPFTRQYSDYLVFSQKNNINLTMHTSQGALMGMMLSGIIGNLGSWCECWYWNDAGYGQLGEYIGPKLGITTLMPRNFYNISFLMGLAQGATVFSVDGQATTGTSQVAIWNNLGQTTETFTRYIVPFIRGVVRHRLVPSKQDVLEKVKIAVEQPIRFQNIAHNAQYGIYDPLYSATYGFRENGIWYEYIPNTSRYFFIPLLPYDCHSLGNAYIANLFDLTDTAVVSNLFNTHYPDPNTGSALVSTVGNSLFVQNTHENTDINEDYLIPLDRCNLSHIAGLVGPHHYILGTFENAGTTLWLQTNTEYPSRNTEYIFTCSWKPAVQVSPASALLHSAWDENSGVLMLRLSHVAGAVEVTLDSADLDTNGRIDIEDFLILAHHWLSSGSELVYDLNHDQIINLEDFAVLAGRIGIPF